jgi:hypothetical protein
MKRVITVAGVLVALATGGCRTGSHRSKRAGALPGGPSVEGSDGTGRRRPTPLP